MVPAIAIWFSLLASNNEPPERALCSGMCCWPRPIPKGILILKRMHQMTVAENVNRVLMDIARKMGGWKVLIGWMADATYPDGTPVAAVMFWNEFGHGGRFPAEPRPAFRNMITKESPHWPAMMAQLAKTTKFDGQRVLSIMGKDIAEALQQSITELTEPPLKQSTLILRKRFGNQPEKITFPDVLSAIKAAEEGIEGASGTQAKPLVWTGHALNSVAFEVQR